MFFLPYSKNTKAHLIKDVLRHIDNIQRIFIKYKIDKFNNEYCQICLDKIKHILLHFDNYPYKEEIITNSSNISRGRIQI